MLSIITSQIYFAPQGQTGNHQLRQCSCPVIRRTGITITTTTVRRGAVTAVEGLRLGP